MFTFILLFVCKLNTWVNKEESLDTQDLFLFLPHIFDRFLKEVFYTFIMLSTKTNFNTF